MPRLFLRVLSDAKPLGEEEGYDIEVAWLVAENDGTIRGHGVTDQRGLLDVADPNVEWLQDPANTVVFIPAHFVLKVACQVPGKSTAQIRRALPFAVEEYVAAEIESMHIAHGPIRAGIPVNCNIIGREQIENWVTCFADVGVKVGYFINDAEMLEESANTANLVVEDDTVLISYDQQAAVIERDSVAGTLAALDVTQITALGGELTDLEVSQNPNIEHVDHIPFGEGGFLDYLANQYRSGAAFINLLQGEFTPERKVSETAVRWRSVAGLAAVWLLVAFVGMVVQGFWAESEADRLEQESYAFYKSMFPRESQPASLNQLRRRMSAKLGQRLPEGAESEFVGLLAQLADVLAANQKVTSISFAAQRGELNAELLLGGYNDLDALKDKLAQAGVVLETTNAEQEGSQVRSRVRVRYQS